jgi:class 3 adenylate cyclase
MKYVCCAPGSWVGQRPSLAPYVTGTGLGIAVHIGARVTAMAAPDEVLVSSTVKDLVAGSGLRFQDRGVHGLRGVPGEWRLFAVERLERLLWSGSGR